MNSPLRNQKIEPDAERRVRESFSRQGLMHYLGAILPFLLAPTAALVGSALGVIELGPSEVLYFGAVHLPYGAIGVGVCVVAAIYYLAWKYFVNFFNAVVGIA